MVFDDGEKSCDLKLLSATVGSDNTAWGRKYSFEKVGLHVSNLR